MSRVIRQTDSIAAGTPGLRSCAVSPVDPSFPFHVEDISTRHFPHSTLCTLVTGWGKRTATITSILFGMSCSVRPARHRQSKFSLLCLPLTGPNRNLRVQRRLCPASR